MEKIRRKRSALQERMREDMDLRGYAESTIESYVDGVRGLAEYRCDHCGHQVHAYLSCRNRHCPQCQTDRADRWFEKSTKLLLPCDYFLFTFTLPEELRSVARSNQRIVYDILIRAAARSLLGLTEDPKYVGGRIAILAILHT